jgi:outer membrane murein-binding lipoprotein Lpp
LKKGIACLYGNPLMRHLSLYVYKGGNTLKNVRLLVSGFVLGTLFLAGCNYTADPDEAGSASGEQQEEADTVTNMEENNGTSTDTTTETTSENAEGSTEGAKGTTAIKNGVHTVLQSISALEQEVNADADAAKIQKLGKEIASNWDSLEKQVEEQYPDWYERIEKNLYPLIGESGKPDKDIKKIKQLSKATKEDLQSFIHEVK